MTTWIFQSNPLRFRLDDYLHDYFQKGEEVYWSIRQEVYLGRVCPGDEVFIWRAKGKDSTSGVVAHGLVTSKPSFVLDNGPEYWIIQDNNPARYRVMIQVDDLRLSQSEGMILKQELRYHRVLAHMQIMHFFQGTNYFLGDEEAAALRKLWREKKTL